MPASAASEAKESDALPAAACVEDISTEAASAAAAAAIATTNATTTQSAANAAEVCATPRNSSAHAASTTTDTATTPSSSADPDASTTSRREHGLSINEDAYRTTYEEVNELFDGVLAALQQLRQVAEHGRHISCKELDNLRKAYLFAVEEQRVVMEEYARRQQLAVPNAAGAHTFLHSVDHDEEGEAQEEANNEDSESSYSSSSTSMPLEGSEGAGSEQQARRAARVRRYNKLVQRLKEKAGAADRMLCALSEKARNSPTAHSYEDGRTLFSWQSLLHTPSERRLQTLTVSVFTFFTGVPLCLLLTIVLLYCRYTAPFMITYILYIFTWGRSVHPNKKNMTIARLRLWQYYSDYFPVRLVLPRHVRRRFDAKKNYFFVYHPHGVHSFGATTCFLTDALELSRRLPGITTHVQTLHMNFFLPFWRTFLCQLGAGDASARCIRDTLGSGPGESVTVVVGGAEEALLTKPHSNDIILCKRKGFIRIALQMGAPLVPTYAFGENNVYGRMPLADRGWVERLLMTVKNTVGFAVPLFTGRGFFNFRFGIMPHRRPIVVVIGAPIEVPQIANPTPADLDLWHERYVTELRKLYNKHCSVYDLESTGLRILR